VVLGTGAEVWLRSLTDVGARFPALLGDTRAAGLCATASLPLRDSDGALIGAMGLAWTAPQQFADDQRDEVRVVAQLAADGLRRARKRDRVAQLTVALNSNAARLSALQNVTAALATAVTTDEIAHVVVSQAIPLIGDHGLVAVLSHDGQSLRTWTSPTQSPHVQDAITIVPLAADLAVAAVVRDDTPHQAQTLLEMTARSPQNADVYRQWNTHSLLIVPAHAAGRPVGALALGFTREHAVDDDVVAFATTLADLMGQALQRAAQYERHAHVAEVLQRSLLPTLPEIVGLELAAVYSPGDQGAQIGGDWYEVFDLGAGQVYLVIGDVMGHDVRAAAVMGQLRAAVHAYASVGHSPAQVLARLHVMIDELADIDLVTCLCAVYDIGQGSLTIANAGHPPPLTAAPGRPTSVLPLTPGPALGAGTGTYTEQTYDVTPGTLLTFFTDGVVETRGQDIDLGIRRLMSFLDASAHRPLATLARDAVAYMGADHARDDDAALLQLRATL
jgi:serine phosphatase RsbU (regulator of sigma subunit)